MADRPATPRQPGGFFPQGSLPSPAPSSASSRAVAGLPHPRGRALAPGSCKEDMVRRYVEDRLLHTSRRYVKKFGGSSGVEPAEDEVVGFTGFSEVCKELDGIVNVLWLSGTPSLQVPFLLKLASDFTQYVRSFPLAPRSTFALLGKLDHCFASLLGGRDVASEEPLPGFDNGLRAGMTVTDMVRCRSLVEQTRVLMVDMMGGATGEGEDGGENEDDDGGGETDDGALRDWEAAAWDVDEERLHMDAARVYEQTIVQLGDRLGEPLVGDHAPTNDVVLDA